MVVIDNDEASIKSRNNRSAYIEATARNKKEVKGERENPRAEEAPCSGDVSFSDGLTIGEVNYCGEKERIFCQETRR